MGRLVSLLGVLVIGAGFLAGMDRLHRREVAEEKKDLIAFHEDELHDDLSTQIDLRLLEVANLKAFFLSHSDPPARAHFARYASEISRRYPDLYALQFVDDEHIIRYNYPPEGNEKAEGLDLMARPAAPYVLEAIQTRKMTVSYPTTTVQGKLSFVARDPIFGHGRYFGLIQGVFNVNSFLQHISQNLDPRFAFTLATPEGKVFWAGHHMALPAHSSMLPVGNGQWRVNFGWSEPQAEAEPYVLFLIWGVGGGLILCLLALVHLGFRKMTSLSQVIKEKTLALQRTTLWAKNIFDKTGDGIIAIDAETQKILFVNPSASRLLQRPAGEITGVPFTSLIPKEDLPSVLTKFEAAMKGAQSFFPEIPAVRGDGTTAYFDVNATAMTVQDRACVVVFFRDASERIHLKKEKEEMEAQVRQSQKMEAVGQLAGGIAHDFNNTLSIILGYTHQAMGNMDPANPLHQDLTEIQNAGERAADITRQLLMFARKQAIRPRMIDVNDVINGMINLLKRLIREDIRLEWRPAPVVWPVKMDPGQLHQILTNLIVNARDAISGGGTVSIETRNTVIDSQSAEKRPGVSPGEYVVLNIRDDGAGMSPETKENLFSPFFTTKPKGKGTGLGLSTVYGIVKQNNGFIEVESQPGKGTDFQIYFPRLLEPVSPIGNDEPGKTEGTANGNETILLVEDEEPLLRMTVRFLESLGYRVLAANSPKQAIELFSQHGEKIDLLLTDVIMPEMNGRQLCDQLSLSRPGLKCVMVSGYPEDVISHQGVVEEQVHFLQKPFSIESLSQVLRSVLRK